MLHDLDAPAQVLLDPRLARPRVALIQPDVRQAAERLLHALEELRDRSAILDISGMDLRFEHQAKRHPGGTRQEMSLVARELLATIVAADTANAGCLDRLAIHDAVTRLRIASLTHPLPFAKGGVRSLPGPIESPGMEVMVDRLPWWELPWEQSPVTASSDNVEDAVADRAPGPFGRPTSRLGSRNRRFQNVPLGIGQIGRIGRGGEVM